ncbi:TPA: hypothetical protein ACGTP8_003148 [Yersinia enterocolitica]
MKLKLMIVLSIISLAGCDSGTPKCNSDEAKSLVVDIAKKEISKSYRAEIFEKIHLAVENVRTVGHQNKLDIYHCAADLKLFLKPEQSTNIPITYNIQKTDDDNKQFYINVFGL